LLTQQEANEIKASIALDGLNQKQFAAARGLSYQRVNRMLSRVEAVSAPYAKVFNRQLRTLTRRAAAIAA
jgi:ParB-like chromosome segregation protein Spo0J